MHYKPKSLAGFLSALTSFSVLRLTNGTDVNCINKLPKSKNYYTVSITNTSEYRPDICRMYSNDFHVLEVIPPDKTKFTYRDVFVCWPKHIRQGTLFFNGVVHETRPKVTVMSHCERHDSIALYSNKHRTTIYILLRMYPVVPLNTLFTPNVRPVTRRPTINQTNIQEKIIERPKRQTLTNYTEEISAIIDSSECGKSRGCYRYGNKGCQHFECDYFVSFWTDNKIVDIELSGKSTGWVAIGFSSDRKMIGDDILACIYQEQSGGPIRVAAYRDTSPHVRPEEVENFHIPIKYAETKNGYMYCRFEVPVKRSYSDVDLTNEWIQFYARGGITGGLMEKHDQTPLMSKTHISIIQRINVNSATTLLPIPLMYSILLVIL